MFTGVRVVELGSGIAPSYAGKLFVDAGAEVIKVEPDGGDPHRRWRASGPPFPEDEVGALWRHLNIGKECITGSVTSDEVVRVIADADVVIDALPAADSAAARGVPRR